MLLCCSRRRPGAAGSCGGLRMPIGCGVSARCLLCVRNHPTTSPLLPSPPASPADVPPDHLPSPLVVLVRPPIALQGAMLAIRCMRRPPSPGREDAACDWGTAPDPRRRGTETGQHHRPQSLRRCESSSFLAPMEATSLLIAVITLHHCPLWAFTSGLDVIVDPPVTVSNSPGILSVP